MPSPRTFPTTADEYAWLTEAQAYWLPRVAAEYPYHMFTAPTLLSTADSGVTYQFPSESAPLAVEVYATLRGPRLYVGQYDDPAADYVWEGSQIRMTTNQARSFSDGAPYARWVASPGTIDASTQPTLKPVYARQLLVDRSLIYWATRGGVRDPSPFRDRETESWRELQEALKNSNPYYGDAANRQTSRLTGRGYLLARAGWR